MDWGGHALVLGGVGAVLQLVGAATPQRQLLTRLARQPRVHVAGRLSRGRATRGKGGRPPQRHGASLYEIVLRC